jgi:hypothetical protein
LTAIRSTGKYMHDKNVVIKLNHGPKGSTRYIKQIQKQIREARLLRGSKPNNETHNLQSQTSKGEGYVPKCNVM